MEHWVGKVAVVTGTSSGIGKSIATELVDRGMTVVGMARRVELVEDLAKSLAGRKGKLHAVRADVSKQEDVVEAFEWVRSNLGSVHVLVNNAGVGSYVPLTNMEREQYKKVKACLNTNVMGVIMCSSEAIKLMREKSIDDGHQHQQSISPGFVQTEILEAAGVPNHKEISANRPILRTDDVTSSVIHALSAPADVQIAEVIVRPVGEEA